MLVLYSFKGAQGDEVEPRLRLGSILLDNPCNYKLFKVFYEIIVSELTTFRLSGFKGLASPLP
jgi:hypothetical protein